MGRLFKIKEDNRILILGSDEIVMRDGKPCVCVRSISSKDGEFTPGCITVEYKEVEEVAIYQMDNGEYIVTKKI